jgi:hypothetical protein
MSTTIPIQDLDPSVSPPSDRTIRAVVTLSWPYSSSTRQCALLLSERDFRLRARGGQIRVKFSGAAARAVAQGKLGIGDEVVLELGAGEWASGAAVHVPGKSVGELHFGRGVQLRVQKDGNEDVLVSVADDVVDEVEQETLQVQATPVKRMSPVTTFRSSIGREPGSAAIYSSPAYMRKAAKFSYLDGISRLFEDEWDNQDLPRKKARMSMGEVKNWKVVDRTPSPEPSAPPAAFVVEEEMLDASQVAETKVRDTVVWDMPEVESVVDPRPIVETQSVGSSPTPAPIQRVIRPASPASVTAPLSSSLEILAAEALADQQPEASITTSTLPKLRLPSTTPTPQPARSESSGEQALDPTTPRLIPLASAALPSTTPQISPLVTMNSHATGMTEDRGEETEPMSEDALPSGYPTQRGSALLTSPNKATESLLDQLRSTTGESEPATGPILPEEAAYEDLLNQWEPDDLAEEDAFSDDEADEVLSAHENDAELMPEDDAEDIFDADELEGEEPSDDDTGEDLDMRHLPTQQWLEESPTEEDSDLEEQASLEDQMDSEMTATERRSSVNTQVMSQQPSFAPASTLLDAAETPVKIVQQPAVVENEVTATTPKKPFFGFDGAVPSTEQAEATTPATKPTDTPKRTPQSAHDKVMKRTFHSLFGLKASPSPEKEDPAKIDSTNNAEASTEKVDEQVAGLIATQIGQLIDNDTNGSQHTQVDVVDVPGDAPVETAVPEKSGSQDAKLLSSDAGPQELLDATVTAAKSPEQITNDVQIEDMAPEMAVSAREPSPELIDLDSSSDTEDRDELMAEAEAYHPTMQPSVSAPTPQQRTAPKAAATSPPEQAGSGRAESTAMILQEDIAELAEPETAVLDVEESSNQDEDLEVDQTMLVEAQKELQALISPGEDAVILEQEAVLPETTPQPEQSALDSLERASVLSSTPESPTIGVKDSAPVVVGTQEPSQTEPPHVSPSPADDNVSVSGDEILHERSERLQSPADIQELDGESQPTTPPETTAVRSEAQVVVPFQEEDIEMLGDGSREFDPSQVSFQSQISQELDVNSAPASPERPTVIEDDIQVDERTSVFSLEEKVEMIDDEREEDSSSYVPIESQVIRDSIGVQETNLLEDNSRPTTKDTNENFSPMVLSSMTQRISDMVSDDSALLRLQELQSEDKDIEIVQPVQEALEDPLMANSLGEDLMEQTPTRGAKIQAVEVELSPSQLRAVSPVKFTRTEHEQEPTPQATFEDTLQETSGTNEEIAAAQEATTNYEDLDVNDTQAVESQLQTELADDNVLQSSNALSPAPVEQSNLLDMSGDIDQQAVLTLPLSPSATQSMRPEAQLPHANIDHATMQPTPATSQIQSSVQTHANLTITKTSDSLTNMSQAETREQEPAEPLKDSLNLSRPQSREKETTNMPPPEQSLPPRTPAKRSLRSRLSNVPDVISAWFSPKRSSIAAQEPEERTVAATTNAGDVTVTNTPRTPKRRASGLSTAHAYFTSLASLGQHVNPSSHQTASVDVLAVVTDFTKEPERAKGGPRDYYTVCRVTDPTISASADVRVEVFRPWKAVLPAADVGDVVLLRAFVVKSKKRQAYLLSTDTSAWCVWRFAEHSKATARGGASMRDGEQPVWARRMSHSEAREEVKGPPVEYGMAEKEQARKLRDWWVEEQGESQQGASSEPVDKDEAEEAEVSEG